MFDSNQTTLCNSAILDRISRRHGISAYLLINFNDKHLLAAPHPHGKPLLQNASPHCGASAHSSAPAGKDCRNIAQLIATHLLFCSHSRSGLLINLTLASNVIRVEQRHICATFAQQSQHQFQRIANAQLMHARLQVLAASPPRSARSTITLAPFANVINSSCPVIHSAHSPASRT